MKLVAQIFVVIAFALTGFKSKRTDDIQFVCLKTHKASNTCHFNFKIDGANYRYVDVGCKYSRKRDEVIKRAQEGSIFLAKEWKVSCGETKSPDTATGL